MNQLEVLRESLGQCDEIISIRSGSAPAGN